MKERVGQLILLNAITFVLGAFNAAYSQNFTVQPTTATVPCQGATITYTRVGYNGSVNWSVTGGTIIGSAYGSTVTVQWNSSGTVYGSYYYENCHQEQDPPYQDCYEVYDWVCTPEPDGGMDCGWQPRQQCDWVYPPPYTVCDSYSGNGSLAVTVFPTPSVYSVSGGGAICAGTTGPSITLSGSQSGVIYQLRLNGSNIGGTVNGTGGALTWSNQTSAGTYTVVGYRSGCSSVTMSGSASITVNPAITSATLVGSTSICGGQSANLSVSISGGTPPYSFTINNGVGLRSNYFSGASISVSPGVTTAYSIIGNVTDSRGCVITPSGNPTVTVNPSITSAVLVGSTSICSGTSASLYVNISGGTGPYSFTIDNGVGLIPSYTPGAPINVSPTANTTYAIVGNVTDSRGCVVSGSGNATISINPSISSAVLSGTTSICSGSSTALTVNISGGTSPYTITINNGVGSISNYVSGTPVMVLPSVTTSYALSGQVVDARGCTISGTGSATITINPSITSAVLTGNTTLCSSQPTPLTVSIAGGTPPYSFVINNGVGAISNYTSGSPISVTPVSSTTYAIVGSVSDSRGCAIAATGNAAITLAPITAAVLSGSATVVQGSVANLKVTVTGGISPFSFTLNNPPGLVNNYTSGTNIPVTPLNTTLYTAAQLTDAAGCVFSTTGDATITVLLPGEGMIPDAVELAVLKDLYDSLGGATWTTKTNWPAPGSWPANATNTVYKNWYGITVANGDITQISLRNNNLIGKIPSSIGNLQKLINLYLDRNKLNGSVPPALGQLSSLARLYLYSNLLVGSIPSEIGNLNNLLELYLYTNKLTGSIPASLGNLSSINQIYLDGNQLAGSIPAELANATSLQFLQLNNNKLTGDITDLSGLVNLKRLYLNNNTFSAGPIPNWLSNLPSIQVLHLASTNRIGDIPSSIGNLITLTQLQLYSNQLTGQIPNELGNLTNLTILYLHANQLTGQIPVNFHRLTKLQYLFLHSNNLSGTLPIFIGGFNSLIQLNLSSNKFSGAIPDSYGSLSSLTTMQLNNNQLSGSIPTTFGNLLNLQALYLQANKLTGLMPTSLGNLNKLNTLYLYTNQLSGELPSALSTMSQMQYFYISGNRFTGNIPASYSAMTKMRLFYVNDNFLSGEFPPVVSSWPLLYAFNINNNKFRTIPNEVSNNPLLTTYSVLNNELTEIPDFSTYINKANLVLDVRNNRLDFSKLEPLVNVGIKSINIVPQKTIADVTHVGVQPNSPLVLTARPLGQFSTIVWRKQNADGTWSLLTNDEDMIDQTYTRNSFTPQDEGKYMWKTANSLITGAGIESDPITVKKAKTLALDNWAFQYKYDHRNRMTHKKVPGADWVYMVYDDRDRLVMTQDGEQRKTNKWSFTKYDYLNRPIMTGIYTHTTAVDQAGMNALISKVNFFDSYNGSANFHGYSNTVFPTDLTRLDVLTVTYYDNYDFKSTWGSEYDYLSNQVASRTVNGVTYSQPVTAFMQVKGQVTGTKVKTMFPSGDYTVSKWVQAINYYDDHYRLIQYLSENGTGGLDYTTNIYDFLGRLLSSKIIHGGKGYVSWRDITNGVSLAGLRIYKSAGGSDWTNGAASLEVLPANTDGWFEYTHSNANNMIVGFSDANPDTQPASIDFGMSNGSTTLSAYQNGASIGVIAALAIGDVIRMERVGNSIRVRRNGVLVYTFPTQTASALLVDVSFFSGQSSLVFTRASFAGTTTSTTRIFDYDHAGRLVDTWHQVDGGEQVLLSHNEYNELGQLIDKKLHSTDNGTTFKQSTDYRYNIRGWLTSVNNADLDVNPVNNDDTNDLFGMELAYETPISATYVNPAFNGNISGMKWSNNHGASDTKVNAYFYEYDPMNRITHAAFRQQIAGNWTNPTSAFTETGYDYDLNGNIGALKRYGKNGSLLDDLTYDYGSGETRGNQLRWVSDAGDALKGFADGNLSGDDYFYDANGNMVVDKNKNITAITYNHLNLPEKVTKGTGEYIKYTYDATGKKLSQQVYAANNVLKKTTDYVSEYVYENDTLRFINTEEGRVVSKLQSGLIAKYSFANSANNQAGGSLQGSIIGATPTLDRQGKQNEALDFDGVNDRIVLSNSQSDLSYIQNNGQFTIAGFIKLDDLNKRSVFISSAASSLSKGFSFMYETYGNGYGNHQLRFSSTQGISGQFNLALGAQNKINDLNWHHVAVVGNGSTITFYVDGVMDGTSTTIQYFSTGNSTYPATFGGTSDSSGQFIIPFDGSMDEFRIYSRDLTESEIKELYEGGGDFEYQYHLKDHLGNVRVTFTTKDEQEANKATLETANAVEEREQFLYYDDVRLVNSILFDKTKDGQGTPPEGAYALRLNGSSNERIGLAKSLAVVPGDVVQLEVYAKYVDPNSGNLTAALSTLLSQIAGGTAAPGTVIDGAGYAYGGSNAFPYIQGLNKSQETGTAPKAYLNYLVFNQDFEPILSMSSFKRMGQNGYDPKESGTNVAHELLSQEIVIKEAGYVYIWLSNDEVALGGSPIEVYFDDFKVTHIKSPVIESQEYYPLGLEFSNYTRENSLPNQYRFQGMEMVNDLDIDLYLTDFRSYDKALGRWLQIDPKASERESPYVAFANNPLRYSDPKGDTVILFIAPGAAGGNGHMGMAFQNGTGNWSYFSQGATGDPSQSDLLTGSDADGGIDLVPLSVTETTTNEDGEETTTSRNPTMKEVIAAAQSGQFGYEYTDNVSLNTTSDEDHSISTSAHQLQRDHASGKKEYNLYSNNCVDACQDAVQNRTGINLPLDVDPRPNSYFEKLQKFAPGFNEERSKAKKK